MIKVHEYFQLNNLKSRMIMQVHDELVFNVVPEEKELLQKEIPQIMENIIVGEIVLKVD